MRSIKMLLSAISVIALSTILVNAQTGDERRVWLQLKPDTIPSNELQTSVEIASLAHIRTPLLRDIQSLNGIKLERVFKSVVISPGLKRVTLDDANMFWVFSYNSSITIDSAIARLLKNEEVVNAGRYTGFSGDYLNPNDYYYINGETLWGFDNEYSLDSDINAVEGWEYSVGAIDQKVMYVDTGIYENHEDFNALNKIGAKYNSRNGSSDVEDIEGHGTNVASILGALTNNSVGVVGVLGGNGQGNIGSQLMVVNAFDPDPNREFWYARGDVADGVVWGINNNADLINLSLSGLFNEVELKWALCEAYHYGIPVISSMGSQDIPSVRYPAAWDDLAIAVGAITLDGNRNADSNYGYFIDVAAPSNQRTATRGYPSAYSIFEATSCSAPFVSGLVGMLLDEADERDIEIDVQEIMALVRASGHQYPHWDQYRGFGYIRSDQALELIESSGEISEKKVTATGGNWTDDNMTITVSVPTGNEAGWATGNYLFKRYLVEFPFTTNPARINGDGTKERVVVWVERDDTNGVLPHAVGWDQFQYQYAAPHAPDFSWDTTRNRLSGKIRSYTYKVYNSRGQLVEWWPVAPQNVTVDYSYRGILVPHDPTLVEASLHNPYGIPYVHLKWTRNSDDDEVIRYQIERADGYEGGSFYHLKYEYQPTSGLFVEYDDSLKGELPDFYRYKVRAESSSGWGPYSNVLHVECGGGGGGPDNADATIIQLPAELSLNQNYPNPFNPSTQIKFGLPTSSHVRLRVMNIRGETVRVLVDNEMGAGWHTVTWDSKNEGGREVASGIYLYLIEADGKSIIKRMTLMR
ncbi:S8 family serine peptidase [Gemmatimonadota bacterium]